jgi:hypothetical protein
MGFFCGRMGGRDDGIYLPTCQVYPYRKEQKLHLTCPNSVNPKRSRIKKAICMYKQHRNISASVNPWSPKYTRKFRILHYEYSSLIIN